jgi:FkbM family methyltransferase
MSLTEHLVRSARALTGPLVFRKSLPRDFGSQKIHVTTRSDIRLLKPGFQESSGDLFTVVRNYVKPGDTVWDIGSNLGILTFASAMQVGPKGKVYSLEADPRYADLQSRTLRDITSDQAGKVSILCAAVANQAGILDLVIPKKGHARNHLSIVGGICAGEAAMTKQVLSVTLDWLLNQGQWGRPDFVKIDVEGAEALAVEGGKNLFEQARPVAYIECAPENTGFLTQYFTKLNYGLFTLGPKGEEIATEQFAFNTIVKPKNPRS